MKKYFPGLIAALLIGGAVIAQDQVQMQGRDSTDVVRVVLVDSSGRLLTTADTSSSTSGTAVAAHGACVNTTQTVTGTASDIPTSALSTRRSLLICASTASEVISCEFDGSAAVLATGIELGDLDCIEVALVGTVAASCISDGTSVDARIMECP